jgi:adenylyltransferase/sulfurtransferase
MDQRYIRQVQLSEVGESGQQKLAEASVLVVGAGGLGCPILSYLAAAGAGRLGIVDPDTIDRSNLHRQLLYSEEDSGKNKAEIAKEKLVKINPTITVESFPVALTAQNYMALMQQYDIIVDGTDDIPTRYVLSDACLLLQKPLVFAALFKFEGQVSVFNYKEGPTYRCLFPDPPKEGDIPNCNEIGVLGVLPGLIGLFQATEVLKIILGLPGILSGKVLYYNVLTHQQRVFTIRRNETSIKEIMKLGKPLDVESQNCEIIPIISLTELKNETDILWIDIREPGEQPELSGPGVLHKPLSKLTESPLDLDPSSRMIFFCQSGLRSQQAVRVAQEQGMKHCLSLKEGAAVLKNWLTK